MGSILNSMKQLLGIEISNTNFDEEIIMHINSVFSILHQLGSPDEIAITASTDEWDDYFTEGSVIELVKSYMYQKIRLMFDLPQNSFLVKAIEKQIEEFEWRLGIIFEPYTLTAEEAATEAEEE